MNRRPRSTFRAAFVSTVEEERSEGRAGRDVAYNGVYVYASREDEPRSGGNRNSVVGTPAVGAAGDGDAGEPVTTGGGGAMRPVRNRASPMCGSAQPATSTADASSVPIA